MSFSGDAVAASRGVSLLSEPQAAGLVPRAIAFRFDILPLFAADGRLHVAMGDAAEPEAMKALRQATRMTIVPVAAPRERIRERLIELYGVAERVDTDASPAVRAVEQLFGRAVSAHASDIHIEPTPDGGRVRYRIDGILRLAEHVPEKLYEPLVARVKVLSGIDIADRRRPHDGRYTFAAHDREIDARVASIPTIDGEKLAIRLLDMRAKSRALDDLGMEASILAAFRRAVHAPYGLVIVTGPTGSGKTTTLYAALHELDALALNICSVEDPIENRIPGVLQVQTNAKAGLTFPIALRAFVRQDPNVIMIGEMRDAETAAVGISAALTGQLVMSTLHSNDAPRTFDRLFELGAERHATASALSAILAQRLVRRLCECKRRAPVPSGIAARFAELPAVWYEPVGCEYCAGTGYVGRLGIFELLVVDRAISDAIVAGSASARIAMLAAEAGYRPMMLDGVRRVASGETSFAEVERGGDVAVASALRIVELIADARERGASDLHVPPREAPAFRIDGDLVRPSERACAADEIEAFLAATFDDLARERFAALGTADMSVAHEPYGMLRIHAFRDRRGPRLAIRLLANDVPALDALDLPAVVGALADRRTGLVLVTGPTGSGKSTVVAGLVDRINRTADRHIVTIEDPIEYYHRSLRSLVAHHEVGRDVPSFAEALRGFMRADPDVIVIGELRDRETMQAALTAAETGHLVIATLHTAETVQAVDRIVDAFSGGEQTQVRVQLALALAAVIGLRLVKRKGGAGRRAACEILIATDAVRALIRENKAHQLRNAIATGRAVGMQTLEAHLDELCALGAIHAADAVRATDRAHELRVRA